MLVDENFSLSSILFGKAVEFAEENTGLLEVGVCALTLLATNYLNMGGSRLFNISGLSGGLQKTAKRIQICVSCSYQEVLKMGVDTVRIQVLQNIPDRTVSLKGIELKETGSQLSTILESGVGENIENYSLKELCENIDSISSWQLPGSIDVAERLIKSLKDESCVLELIQFCSNDSSKVQSLFAIMHYLGLDAFQSRYLEPFQKVFPNISLSQFPKTINYLYHDYYLHLVQLRGKAHEIELSKFECLKSLRLANFTNSIAVQFNAIPNKKLIETLVLRGANVMDLDLSGLERLSVLEITDVEGLIPKQFNAIPNKFCIEGLILCSIDVTDFEFVDFINLEFLKLSGVEGLTAAQFNAIPNKGIIKRLFLGDVNVAGFDFSKFENLRVLDLNGAKGLTATQFNSIPNKASIEGIGLEKINVKGFSLLGLTNLREFGSSRA
jgi:hypothetical protein